MAHKRWHWDGYTLHLYTNYTSLFMEVLNLTYTSSPLDRLTRRIAGLEVGLSSSKLARQGPTTH